MNRVTQILVGVVGAVALLGFGIVVGSNVGSNDTQVAEANVDKPYTERDALVIPTFAEATRSFEQLIAKARDGKDVSKQLTQQALLVHRIGLNAESEEFQDVASSTGEAMILMAAAVTADDGQSAQLGLQRYKEAQDKINKLVEQIQNEQNPSTPVEGDEPANE